MDAVVEAVQPTDGTQDAEAARAAIKDALSELLTIFPEADLLNLNEDQRGFAIEHYVAIDVFRRFQLDLGKTIQDKAPTATAALARLKEVKNYIKETVAAAFRKLRTEGSQTDKGARQRIRSGGSQRGFQVFEDYAHEAYLRAKRLCVSGNEDVLEVVLYGHADRQTRGSAGAAVKDDVIRAKLSAAPRAWDFLSLALSATAADLAGHRRISPDGWTRELSSESRFRSGVLERAAGLVRTLLGFLTTDRWEVSFIPGGIAPAPKVEPVFPEEDCVTLLSGGLDSFIGTIDLVTQGKKPFAVSQVVTGDADNQRAFARAIGGGLKHLQVNHNAHVPDPESPPSQRARSLIFHCLWNFGGDDTGTLSRGRASPFMCARTDSSP